jgi:hypothetical protein
MNHGKNRNMRKPGWLRSLTPKPRPLPGPGNPNPPIPFTKVDVVVQRPKYGSRPNSQDSYEVIKLHAAIPVLYESTNVSEEQTVAGDKPGANVPVCNQDVPVEVSCRFNPNNKVNLTVPADTFCVPPGPQAQEEANELARLHGEQEAASSLDCTVFVTFKLTNNVHGATAYVYVTDPDNVQTGPYTVNPNPPSDAVALEDHALCTYRATFYHPTKGFDDVTGSFIAMQGLEKAISVPAPNP